MRLQFDIKYRPQIESGEYKVETKGGVPVHILSFEALGPCPICYQVGDGMDADFPPRPEVCFANNNGECSYSPNSLFIVTPEPELTEFEQELVNFFNERNTILPDKDGVYNKHDCEEFLHKSANKLLAIAREQFIKDGYIIEKKAFHDVVENISDKHLAEMSVQYSIHCKVEDGTRHAIMNWDTFQKVAQKFIDIGKAEALKDLPRWRKWRNGAAGNSDGHPIALTSGAGGFRFVSVLGITGEKYIMLDDLKKLPGFKEDEK